MMVIYTGIQVKPHKMQKIALKMVKVDELMVPIIKWLNSLNGVFTLHSCQSLTKKEMEKRQKEGFTSQGPHVVFYCEHVASLIEIHRVISGRGRIEVTCINGMLRYYLEFPTQELMQLVIEEKQL